MYSQRKIAQLVKAENIKRGVIDDIPPFQANKGIGKNASTSKITEVTSSDSGTMTYNYSGVNNAIARQDAYADNPAFRPIKSHRKILGKSIVFCKRIIRKVLKWYVEPVCNQQTDFNRATAEVSHSIEQHIVDLEERMQGASSRIIGNEVRLFSQEERQITLETGLNSIEKTTIETENKLTKLESIVEESEKRTSETADRLMMLETTLKKLGDKLSSFESKLESTEKTTIETNNKLISLETATQEAITELKPSFEFGSIVSSSQSGEDLIVAYVLDALHIPFNCCTYLDLGANHAKFMSNSYFFYRYGARGVLVEANPDLITELKENRPGDVILHNCLGNNSGEQVTFYVLNGDGLSSPNYEYVLDCLKKNKKLYIDKEIQVETKSIKDILLQYFREPPVLVNLDIEGMELDLLHEFDLQKYRPLCFIIEMINYTPGIHAPEKNEDIIQFMMENEYVEYAFTGINSIFIDAHRLSRFITEEK